MAASLIPDTIMHDLTECSICLSLIEDPKALPCLHTFCLKCIQDWAKETSDVITCPICQESCPIPPDGVQSLKSNFFITKLKETRLVQEKLRESKVPCTCCNEDGVAATARCLECKDFLCDQCVQMHQTMRPLKGHRVTTLEELRSGKTTISGDHQEYCDKHRGQVLWFYCNTCNVPICRDCTVVDHPAGTHQHTDLQSTAKSHKKEIQTLIGDCCKVATQVEICIRQSDEVANILEKALQEASGDLDGFAQVAKAKLLASLEDSYVGLKDELQQLCEARRTQMVVQKQTLILQQSRLRTALETANRVLQMGSQSDITAIYSTIVPSMQQLSELTPTELPNSLSRIKFRPNKGCLQKVLTLGTFTLGGTTGSGVGGGTWDIEKKFGIDGPGMLSTALDIAASPHGEVAVADNDTAQIKVYTKVGQFKFGLDTKQGLKAGTSSYPRGIVVNPDGYFFVTDGTQVVKVYDTHGHYVYHFASVSPSGTPSDIVVARLAGIAIDHQGQLLVGEITQQYISIHDQNSSHIKSIKLDIDPNFIAVASRGEIVVSSCDQHRVHVINESGSLLHSLDPPSGLSSWYPTGVCCSPDDEIFIASQGTENAGIYRYALTGEYLGCVTQTVDNPCGLVFAEDDRLLVADWKAASCFRLKYSN